VQRRSRIGAAALIRDKTLRSRSVLMTAGCAQVASGGMGSW
jgi:hypothetical protein